MTIGVINFNLLSLKETLIHTRVLTKELSWIVKIADINTKDAFVTNLMFFNVKIHKQSLLAVQYLLHGIRIVTDCNMYKSFCSD